MLLIVWRKPRQLESESTLHEAAIKILMRRAHSVYEMKKALARRCEDEKLIQTVIDRLKSSNLLDDARYAKQFTRVRSESRKQGQFRIARDLRSRGIPDKYIEQALRDSAQENDPAALVRHRIERKLRLYRGEISEKKIASLYRSLLAAGFPSDIVRKELFRVTREEVPESDSDSNPKRRTALFRGSFRLAPEGILERKHLPCTLCDNSLFITDAPLRLT